MYRHHIRRLAATAALVLALVGLVLSSLPAPARASVRAASRIPSATIAADTTWRAADSPIQVDGYLTVASGATLTIEPGVTVRFAANTGLTVAGALSAVGTPDAPILFTGATPAPGSWQGLVFYGTEEAQASGTLRHVTVEYGGFGTAGGNIYVNKAQVAISDSTLRRSAGAGLMLWSRAAGSSITRSRIVENAGYGLYTPEGVARQAVLATANWWGHPTGPATDSGCNSRGQGARISRGVAFAPFLTAADAAPPDLAPSAVRLLTVSPERWFALADATARIYVTITARDGDGSPLPGRRTRLISSLGSVVDGGVTDAQGRSFAWLSSSQAGDATLTAELDLDGDCEFARSGAAAVTFTPAADEDLLAPGAAAPYASGAMSVGPQPLVRGVPATLTARLVNPGKTPLVVEGRFGFAQSGIGLAFGPIGAPQTLVIEPGAAATFAVTFTPPLEGHYCFSFDYSYRSGDASLAAGRRMQINAVFAPGGRPPVPNFLDGVTPGPEQLPWHPDEGIDAALGFFWRNPIGAINFWSAQASKREAGAQQGGQRPNLGTAAAGQPRTAPVYQRLTPPRSVVVPERPVGEAISPALRDAGRAGAVALVAAAVNLEAAVLAEQRYKDAVEAGDMQWASLQASAFDQYGREASAALRRAATEIERYVQVLRAEGFGALSVSAEQAAGYQERLREKGLTDAEVTGLRQMGLEDAAIEELREGRLAVPPTRLAGDLLARLADLARIYRGMADDLEAASHFGTPEAPAGLVAAPTHSLARAEVLTQTIQLGNPFADETTINLRVRPIDLPADWSVRVSPAQVTLQAGEQRSVIITISPGVAMQGGLARVAVEGYAQGALIDGVAFSVPVPQRVALPANRVYLPLLMRAP